MTPSETIRLPGDGLTLAAEVFGDPAAAPVLFFHGGGQSRSAWRGAARKVAQAGYRSYTVDLRGHGESGWAEDGDYLLDAYGRDVAHILRFMGRPAALVGASRGGQAALVGAARHQEFVSLVMLADVAPLLNDRGIDSIRGFLHRSLLGFDTPEEAAETLAELLHKPNMTDASGLRKTMREDAHGRLFWRWDPRTVDPEFLNPPSENIAVEEAAAVFKKPIMLVRAGLSDVVTDAGVARLKALCPQVEVTIAQGVGHMFTGDRNDAFANTLLAQLAQLAQLAR